MGRAVSMLQGGHGEYKMEVPEGGRESDLSFAEEVMKTVQASEQGIKETEDGFAR